MFILIALVAIINLILFEWHRRHYRNEKRKFRVQWCSCMFGFSIGPSLWTLFDLIYSNPIDFRALWWTLIFFITSIIMLLINYKTKTSES